MRVATNLIVFGSFRIDASAQTLWNGTRRLKITTKSLALLQYLVRNAGRVVTKEELLDVIWSDTHVNVGIIKTCVAEIRRVLGDNAESPRFIEAVRRRGYRFIASVGVGDLPVPLTSFVGRESELPRLRHLLEYGRLVTLRGPAGVGKTRLAIEVASRIITDMPYGVWWVDLSPVVDPGLLPQTVVNTLSIRDYAGRPVLQTLADEIVDRRLLLVLDNCEHLIEACASLADRLLRSCPNLKILATSREPLRVAGESVYTLVPLLTPESSEHASDVVTSDAVRLFVERAKDAEAAFTISDGNAAAVASICRQLDGLPLAIELAAGRVSVLAPEQIAARLDDVFGLLGHGARLESPRHQTLKAAFDWSYELLPPRERQLFGRLSVFSAPFSLAAVESVCGGEETFTAAGLLDLMASLVDRSLVTVTTDRSAKETRYRLLDTVRQYAREKLPADVREQMTVRHARYFLRLAEEVAPSINTSAASGCLARLDRERESFRASLRWAIQTREADVAVRLTVALYFYWLRRGQLREGRQWLEEALALDASSVSERTLADALCDAGVLAWLHGDTFASYQRLEESLRLCRITGDAAALGRALYHLSLPVAQKGELDTAERLGEEAVDVLRRVDSPWDLATALTGLGILRRRQHRMAEAADLYEEAASILRSISDPWTLFYPLSELASLASYEGKHEHAEKYWRESLAVLRPLDETWFVSVVIAGLSQVDIARRDYTKAVRLAGAADSLRRGRGLPAAMRTDLPFERLVEQLRSALGDEGFEREWARGRLLSRNEAIGLALGFPDP